MLDIKFIRENPDAVKENIKKKFQEEKLPLVDQVIALDEYVPQDVTAQARELADSAAQDADAVFGPPRARIPAAGTLRPPGKRKPCITAMWFFPPEVGRMKTA